MIRVQHVIGRDLQVRQQLNIVQISRRKPEIQVLLIDHQENLNLSLAARNLSDVQLLANLQVTPYHVLNAKHVVFSKAAIEALQEVLTR